MEGTLSQSRRSPWLAVLLVFFCYAYFTYDWPVFRNTNEYSRFYLLQAMVDYGRFSIDDLIAVRDTQDKARHLGRYYSNKAPGASFLAVPAYLVLRRIEAARGARYPEPLRLYFIKVAVVALPSALFLLALYRFWGNFGASRSLRLPFLLAYALGTIAWPYSAMFYGHQLAAIALFLAFVVIRTGSRASAGIGSMVPAGFLCGLAFMIEYPAAVGVFLLLLYAREAFSARRLVYYLLAAALLVYAAVNWYGYLPPVVGRAGAAVIAAGVILVFLYFCRRGAPVLYFFLVGSSIPLAALFYYHWSCFGHPLSFPYMFEDFGQFALVPGQTFSGFVAPRLEILGRLLAGSRRGLFVYSPFLVLALPGLAAMIRERGWRKEGVFFAAVGLFYLLFLAAFVEWEGGWAMGPRHLVPILPFLATAAVFLIARRGESARSWLSLLFGPLAVFSLTVTFLGTATFPYFPLAFANPIYEVGWRLFAEGRIAGNLGILAGLSPGGSLLPVLAVAAAMALAIVFRLARTAGPDRGVRAIFIVLSLVFFLLLAGGGWQWSRRAEGRLNPAQRALGELERSRIAWYTGY